MNYVQEKYPEGLDSLLKDADKAAISIVEKLNALNCKRVGDLYDIVNGKTTRNKKEFDELGYTANESNEFKGLYIFGEEKDGRVIPVYVGISRTVFRRLRQHAWGKNHNECTLAYLKTRDKWKKEGKITDRASITNEDMTPAKKVIQNYKVVLHSVPKDYDLYFLEVVLAGKFKTKWNSFRTH
ncbi:hypothetical protein SAMN04488062_12026 [Flavobacterium omnivorum]|uniref:GIY-YIG domain-containing protein n=1 Tax=Flavobacterium omnivorum TaxID=178355 RepID=A0A1G8H4N9_9FLAO|nr:hypothetical protein [Flavobacterium omnivorum]SDI01622.1 hypothetical protein SAMN04488062_12026 [Flavobacterium omnivorum]